jgi:hypothetical protein
VLSTQVSTVIFRLRNIRLACGIVLDVSRDAVATGEKRLVSCSAKQIKYFFICTVTPGPCGDIPFASLGRWQCLIGGVDAGLNSCYAACGCGAEYRFGALPGGDVWRHAGGDGAHCPFAAQRGDGAHGLSRNGKISLDQFCQVKTPEQDSFN